ncbi:MAG TPA: type II toxin-antitoxin system HicB family antitoxin [Longimicrobiaceae bacterium]|nr:type II toxin-antitoxin system HicB family antitoxin [Longimicrobiaceae bacterium]
MRYKGYTARVEYDLEDGVFAGRVENIRDVVTFEATDVESLEREFRTSVDEYIAFCEEGGAEPEKPFSGRVLVRMPPALHKAAADAARAEGTSLNAWINAAVSGALGVRQSPATGPVVPRRPRAGRRSS